MILKIRSVMHITNERRCIACRNHFLKQELIRISKGENGILVDDKTKVNGRGIYLCKNPTCIDLCVKKKLINKAFSQSVENNIYELILSFKK